jgi:hypothetical protein
VLPREIVGVFFLLKKIARARDGESSFSLSLSLSREKKNKKKVNICISHSHRHARFISFRTPGKQIEAREKVIRI